MQLPVTEFKDQCIKLVHDLPQMDEDIQLTENGKVVAKLLPVKQGQSKINPAWGSLKGTVTYIADDFDEPLSDKEWEASQ